MKKIGVFIVSMLCIFFSSNLVGAQNINTNTNANLVTYIKQNLSHITVNENTIAHRLYPVINPKNKNNNNNDNANNKKSKNKVYFFGGYSFFTIQKKQELAQVKKQLNREDILVLFKEGKVLIVSNYIDPQKSCSAISPQVAEILDAYPEKFKVSSQKVFLVGNETEKINCYTYNGKIYLPNDELSRRDLEYLVNNTDKIQQVITSLQGKSLNKIYHYITKKTSYDYDALDYDQSILTPYLASSFFQGKKVVCDGYSKTFSFLAKLLQQENTSIEKIQRITGTRQQIDKKDEKSFLHSWVKIGDKYYDPTFDDNDDKQEKNNYFAKSQICFNLDHYSDETPGRKMFTSEFERTEYSKKHSQELIKNCPKILSQTIGKDKAIREFIQYSLQKNSVQTTKKFMCDAYQICALSANNRSDLANELAQYTIQFGDQTITLKQLSTKTEISPTITSQNEDTATNSTNIDPQTKKILDQVIKKIKIQLFFYTPEQKERFLRNIKMKIMMILLDKKVPEEVKTALKYINEKIKDL